MKDKPSNDFFDELFDRIRAGADTEESNKQYESFVYKGDIRGLQKFLKERIGESEMSMSNGAVEATIVMVTYQAFRDALRNSPIAPQGLVRAINDLEPALGAIYD